MKYYLDTEFDGFGGALISLALVREDGQSIYLVDQEVEVQDEWVKENVIPILFDIPEDNVALCCPSKDWGSVFAGFLYEKGDPQIICDWPSDAVYIAELLMTGPGIAVPMSNQTHITILRHVDIYPTTLEGAVQHNAWWDAMAIKRFVEENND